MDAEILAVDAALKEAAREAREKQLEEQKKQAYKDASTDGAMYKQYADGLAKRITEIQAKINGSTVKTDKDKYTAQLAKATAAKAQADSMNLKQGDIFASINATKTKEAADFAAGAAERELEQMKEELGGYKKQLTTITAELAKLQTMKDGTQSTRRKAEYTTKMTEL